MDTNKAVNKTGHLEHLSVKCLNTYVRDRGAHLSRNKAELLKRAKGVADLGIQTLREINLRDNGTCNVEDIPHVSENDLYNYLVLNRRRTFDAESMKAKRQPKARVFYEDRHVHDIKFHPLSKDCTHGFVKCKVIPSLLTLTESKEPDYDVWISLSNETGNVYSAGCTCSAGEGESCNLVAGLLYALVDISSKKKDGLNSPTSDACKWSKPRSRKLGPNKSQDLTFKKLKFSKECSLSLETKSQAKPIVNIIPDLPIEPVDVMEFKHKVQKLHNIDHMHYDKADLQSDKCIQYFNDYFASLHCKKARQTTQNWFAAYTGRITSSKCGRVCKLKKTTYLNSNLREVMGYTKFDIDSVRWGRTHEQAAKHLYQVKSKIIHTYIIVIESGLWLIEVKCPFKFRDMTPLEEAKDPSFCCQVIGGELKLNKICERKWCDFVIWTLKGYNVERILCDDNFWILMLDKLNSFYLKAIIPELFSQRIKRGMSL
ncbi:hypothetical protein ACJMK2_026114 [Sinanodonta woodiana]|uniref:SWIM-type domain-containing protein n=1 Tax=Sinanodonta woodiana TaxID=1069815 RepID=A0ABD3XKD1_SINWO